MLVAVLILGATFFIIYFIVMTFASAAGFTHSVVKGVKQELKKQDELSNNPNNIAEETKVEEKPEKPWYLRSMYTPKDK